MKVKSDHRSKFSNLSNWKEEAWKKSGLQRVVSMCLRWAILCHNKNRNQGFNITYKRAKPHTTHQIEHRIMDNRKDECTFMRKYLDEAVKNCVQ